jgi:plastocyanin
MRFDKRTLTGLATVALVALVAIAAGCYGGGTTGGTTDTPGTGLTVTESGLAFTPGLLEVRVGDTVTFVNEDSVDHQVLIDGVTLARQTAGESVTWTAETVGTMDYICTLHPAMMGRIVVMAAQSGY